VNSCGVSTSGCVTRCSEREVAVFRIVVYSSDFLKMLQQSHLKSFDTELFMMNYNSYQPFATRSSLPAALDKKKHTHGIHYADLPFRQTTSVTCENT
jgi:hypothetical protein